MVFNRQLYKQKPSAWGPVSAVQASIFKNAERIGIDPTIISLVQLCWGSGNQLNYINAELFTNTNGVFTNSVLSGSAITVAGSATPDTLGTGSFTIVQRFKPDLIRFNAGGAIGLFNLKHNGNRKLGFMYNNSGYRPFCFGTSGSTEPKSVYDSESIYTELQSFTLLSCRELSGVKSFVINKTEWVTESSYFGTGSAENYAVGTSLSGYGFYGQMDFTFAFKEYLPNPILLYWNENPYYLLQRVAPVYYSVPGGAVIPAFNPLLLNAAQPTRVIQ